MTLTYAGLIIPTLSWIGIVAGIVALYRQIYAKSVSLGTVVAVGILIRAVLGAGLFWISYLDLPLLNGLHDGDGFWELAPDARGYFTTAERAVEGGLATIPSASPAPTYTRSLAAWMLLVGVSPASAILLNLLSYVLLCRAIVGLGSIYHIGWAQVAIPVVAFTFSPALLIFGTQSLKDSLFVFLVGAVSMGWLIAWEGGATATGQGRGRSMGLGFAVVAAATYLIAGIRPYFSLLICISAAVMFVAVAGHRLRREPTAGRYAVWSIAALAVLWICFMVGAGPHYATYSPASPARYWPSTSAAAPSAPAVAPAALLDRSREAFVQAGGATNIAPATDGRLTAELRGLAVLFVPISILKSLSAVNFPGGRGLLLVTDLDTIFVDLTLCFSLVSVFSRRVELGRNFAPACFLLFLAAITTLLMAYVVTNYGTLFRLRLMLTVPIWMLPVVVPGAAISSLPAATRRNDLVAGRSAVWS